MRNWGRLSRFAMSLGLGVVPILWLLLPRTIAKGGDAPIPSPSATASGSTEPNRSPIALALSADGTRLLVANQTAGTVALVDTKAGRVLHEVPTGSKPAG